MEDYYAAVCGGLPLSLTLAVAALFSQAAPGGAPTVRWPRGRSVLVWIQKDGARERNRELVRVALANWADAAGGSLRFEESETVPEKGLRVFFSRNEPHFGTGRPVVDTERGEIQSADVIIASDPMGDRLQRDLIVYLTALHELGHVLGLAHTDNLGEIMFGFREPSDATRTFERYRQGLRSIEDIGTPRASGLTDADRRAIQALYTDPPAREPQ